MSDDEGRDIKAAAEAVAKNAGVLRVLMVAAGALLAAGFAGAVYFNQFAHADELKAHVTASQVIHDKIGDALSSHTTSIAVMQETLDHIEEDLHWHRDQAIATARRVGAAVVPAPHKERP